MKNTGMKNAGVKDAAENVIQVGNFDTGVRVYVQYCRKCGVRHESTHVLFVCQNEQPYCNGTMTPVKDFYDVEAEA